MRFLKIWAIVFGCLISACADTYEFKGDHLIASYCDCDLDKINDVVSLEFAMRHAIEATGATIMNQCKYMFNNGGFMMVFLLSESHATIHTYPEHKSCFVDIFTCGEDIDVGRFNEKMICYLRPKKVSNYTFVRDEDLRPKVFLPY